MSDDMDRQSLALFVAYVVASVAIWSIGLGMGGGDTVALQWQGAVLNGALLLPLWRRAEWARHVLMICALALAIGIGSEGFPPSGPAFGLLAFGPALQILLLIYLGKLSRGSMTHALDLPS